MHMTTTAHYKKGPCVIAFSSRLIEIAFIVNKIYNSNWKTDDVLYEIDSVYEYRPDLLAYDLYGDSALWWVFAQRNPNVIKDPLFDFRAGYRIYIPQKTTLQQDLGI